MKQYARRWDIWRENEERLEQRMISWKKPEPCWCKVNTDGMVLDTALSGCGGVIKGDQGEWLRGFSCKLESCNAKIAEMWGILEGMKLAWETGFKKVIVESDAEQVVGEINTKQEISGCYFIGSQIQEMLKRN